jgi:chromosome segregation ATPase
MKQREFNAHDTVAAAARAAARGEGYDVGAIETALVEARLSMEDFEKAVEIAGKRSAWLRDFEKLATMTNKVTKVEAAIAAEQARFEEQRRAFMQKAEALDAERAAAQTARDAGKNARDQLLDPRLVPGTIGEKYRQAVAEADAADEAVAEVERQLREFDRRIKSEEEWIVQLAGKPEKSLLNYLPIKPPEAAGESYKLEEHRTALVRNQRRKAEAEAQLVEVKKAATKARKAVEALVPDVLKA